MFRRSSGKGDESERSIGPRHGLRRGSDVTALSRDEINDACFKDGISRRLRMLAMSSTGSVSRDAVISRSGSFPDIFPDAVD